MEIGIAGDWHGNRAWAMRCIAALATQGIDEVYHLGDFGIWPGAGGVAYLRDLERALEAHGMPLFVTPGNHEDYDQIDSLPALDLGHGIGPVRWITDHIAVLPRGHRWERNGWSFVSLGGAPSIDRWSRREGTEWWAAEAIDDDDVDRVVRPGPADVMLAHDAPDPEYATAKVAEVVTSNPSGWPQRAVEYCAQGRHRMTTAFRGVRPRLFLHGHFHLRDERWIDAFGYPTHLVSVDCDGSPDGNLLVLTLPDRADELDGSAPSIRWLELPPVVSHTPATDDLFLPHGPAADWTIEDLLRVLDDGRSLHWATLDRLAVDDEDFAARLVEALGRTGNQLAVNYLPIVRYL